MRVPASTYRIQLRAPSPSPTGHVVTFADVEAALPALAELGIGALYLSPIFAATKGSTHGYDVVDPTEVSSELGGFEGLRSLRVAAKLLGIGLVVDIVPNHLGVAMPNENPWWWDALQLGRDSRFFSVFDFDDCADNGADGRLALPVLGAPGDTAALELDDLDGEPVLRFHERVFPIAPGTGEGTPQEVHARQSYRLVHRREPVVGYRRFLTINELAAVRQEDAEVFELTHRALSKLVREGLVDGIRVDHSDGLADPIGYTRRLRELVGPDRWVVVEKILGAGEILDPTLAVEGTTGYDFLSTLSHLLLDPDAEPALSRLAAEFIGEVPATARFKRELLGGDLHPDVRRLARLVDAELGGTSASVDALGAAIAEIVAATPYYRADYPILAHELPWIVDDLAEHIPEMQAEFEALSVAMARNREATARLAQITGAATATAEEDRRFYLLGRLVALNEVGGDPESWSLPVASFHLLMRSRAVNQPYAMSALSTHDTKRGEDVRARLIAMTQYPERWAKLADTLRGKNVPPARGLGYFLLQNIIGVWPAGGLASLSATECEDLRARLHAYATKSAREAGTHTSWTEPDAPFEAALGGWVDAWFDRFPDRLDDLVAAIDPAGRATSLAAKAIQLLAPGVPDVYQGTEIWEDSLVDPDNRRPVTYDGGVHGHPKTALVRCALSLRRRMPEVFTDGDYIPVAVSGTARGRVLAFARALRQSRSERPVPQVLLVARLLSRDAESRLRGDIELPAGEWRFEHGDGDNGTGTGTEGDAEMTITGRLDAALLVEHPVIILVRV